MRFIVRVYDGQLSDSHSKSSPMEVSHTWDDVKCRWLVSGMVYGVGLTTLVGYWIETTQNVVNPMPYTNPPHLFVFTPLGLGRL